MQRQTGCVSVALVIAHASPQQDRVQYWRHSYSVWRFGGQLSHEMWESRASRVGHWAASVRMVARGRSRGASGEVTPVRSRVASPHRWCTCQVFTGSGSLSESL